VQEVEMAARQPLDLRERLVHALHVEGAAALEEGLLVAEVADVRAAARDHDRVGYEVEPSLDEIAAEGRHAAERPRGGAVDGRGPARPQVGEEAQPGVLPGSEEDR